MKSKITLLIFAFLLFCLFSRVYSQSNWFTLNTGVGVTLQALHFPSADTGWAAGENGTIIFTSNAGNNWTAQMSGVSGILNSIKFINNHSGWAAGEFGNILFTSNGGINWVNQTSPTSEILYGISFVNNTTGWVCGYYGTVLKTTNAGVNWIQQNSSTYSYLRAIFFTDTNNGVAVGYNGEIIKTSNGGNTWTQISFNTTATLYSLYFINSNYGWAGGLGSQRTTDGGLTWSLMPGGYGTLGIYFSDINTGWEVGFNQIFYTVNSGLNWYKYNLNFSGWLYGVQFTSPAVGYICGDYGTIYKTTDGGGLFTTNIKSLSNKIPDNFELHQNYPNPFNPSTKIKFNTPLNPPERGRQVQLIIYDILGREAATLVNKKLNPGTYEVEWNRSKYPSGIYFYKIISGDFTDTKKMILIK